MESERQWDDVPPECVEAIDQIGEYLAAELDESRKANFIHHMQNCRDCHDKLIALEAALYLASEPEEPDPPDQDDLPIRNGRNVRRNISLSEEPYGPRMYLLGTPEAVLIYFDGIKPEAKYQESLREAGWQTKDDGDEKPHQIWTMPMENGIQGRAVERVLREFANLADAIRRDNGMGPAMQGRLLA
jgi:Putative zinc-finger